VFSLLFCLNGERSQAQNPPFNSGSTGHEGALSITASGVTYFDPVAMNLNPVVPGIFNFTTINIAAGSTLKFTENKYHGPVYFLVSGDVTIAGTLDLTGDPGYSLNCNTQLAQRIPNAAGSGGFSGGIGGCGTNYPPMAGNGPGGGATGAGNISSVGGSNTSNEFLVPLIGGSGGGGFPSSGETGGAGGGAIMIASSTTISLGTINASGANGGCPAGGGAGGSVRLVANTISNTGILNLAGAGGCGASTAGGTGWARFESNNLGNPSIVTANWTKTVPYALNLPATPTPSIKVTTINGQPINSNPFTFPDTTINTTSPVPITIQAQYVPVGTIAKIYIFSEAGPDQVINIGPLTGPDQTLTTATANITYPPGGSRGFVKATW
jgi:hypothetical protein